MLTEQELMREAADDFSDALGDQVFADRLALPVVTNVSGEVVSTGARAAAFTMRNGPNGRQEPCGEPAARELN